MTLITERDNFGNFVTYDDAVTVPATAPTASFVSAPVNAFAGNSFPVVFDLKHPRVLDTSITASTLTVTGPAGSAPIVSLDFAKYLGVGTYRVQWLVNPIDGQEGFYNCQIEAGGFTSTTPTNNTASDSHATRVFGNPFTRPVLAPSWQHVFKGIQGTYDTDPEVGTYNRYRIPTMVVAGNGDLLLFAEGRELGDLNKVDTIYSRSTDNGLTWSSSVLVAGSADNTVGNPTVIIDETTQRIHLFYVFEEEDQIYRFSDDNGLTWSAEQNLTPTLTSGFFNSIYIESTGRRRFRCGPGGGIQIKNGPYAGRLIALAFYRFGTSPEDRVIASIYSDDNGTTWSLGNSTTSGVEAHIAELSDGSLITINRNQELLISSHKIINRSTDGGVTWGPYDVVDGDNGLVEQVCQNSIERIWFGSGNQNIILGTSLDSTNTDDRSVLYSTVSLDDGSSWPITIRRLLWKYWGAYSEAILLPDGYIGIVCERNQNFFVQNIDFTRVSLAWLLAQNNDQFYEDLQGISPSPEITGNWSNFNASTRNGWTADGNQIGQYFNAINSRRRMTSATTFTNGALGNNPAELRIRFALRIDQFAPESTSSTNAGFRLSCVRDNERSYFLIADNGIHHRTNADAYPLITSITTEVFRWYEWRLDINFNTNVTTVFRDGVQIGTYPIDTIGFSAQYIRFLAAGDSSATTYCQFSIKWAALDDNLS